MLLNRRQGISYILRTLKVSVSLNKKEGKTLNTFILQLMHTELKRDTLKKQLTWNLHRSHQSLPVSLSFCLLVQQADFRRCTPSLSCNSCSWYNAYCLRTTGDLQPCSCSCYLPFPNQDHADTYTAENLTKLMKDAEQQWWRSVPWKPTGIWLCDPEPISSNSGIFVFGNPCPWSLTAHTVRLRVWLHQSWGRRRECWWMKGVPCSVSPADRGCMESWEWVCSRLIWFWKQSGICEEEQTTAKARSLDFQSSGTVFFLKSFRDSPPLKFSSTTSPHFCSSDDSMTYRMDFCRDQYWSASLVKILLLFTGEKS